MSEEIKRAAERLRRLYAGENVNLLYPDLATGFGPMNDRSRLADAYLAEHSADSDEPLTEEWLRSVAPVTRALNRKDCVEYLIAAKLDIECYFGRRWALVCGALIVELNSKGHARRLLSDLGIKITEPGAS